MSAISIKGLKKYYGNIRAVDGLDLEIPGGTVFGLLGPNGSGKTTAIKVLCGLLKADSGRARVLGTDLPEKSHLPRIGYMPQETALYEDLTVHDNLKLFAGIYGLSKDTFRRREEEVLRNVDLLRRRDFPLSDLSGGQKHRVSLAASMIHEPELLFLDEPTVGVDPPLRARFWRNFHSLKRSEMTIVMSTHYMDEARNCDTIGMMREGRLIAMGTPGEIMQSTGRDNLEDAFLDLVEGGSSK
jgi:ABC-2 type transport system ATP-binding protein